jgi:antirestriction protein
MDTSIGNDPRVWVGCLGCYNAGRLRGVWITAAEMLDELAANHVTFKGLGVPSDRGTLCALCGGEEWDVMDSEGVPRDCQNVRGFMDNADALVEMDADVLGRLIVLGGWLGGSMSFNDLFQYDEENYCGQFDSFREYAEQLADDGLLGDMPDMLAQYFDWDAWARDLAYDYYYDDASGHVWRSA